MNSRDDHPSASLLDEARSLKFEARHEEALGILEELLIADPNNVEALEEVADNELSLGQYERAEQAAKSVLILDPRSCNAHYIVGFVASQKERWSDSVTSLKLANASEPNDPEILRCLGWSLFSLGEEVEGLVTLERALNLEPENPLILCDLGVVCLKLRDFTKAISLLERALEIDPTNDRARECLEMSRRIETHTRDAVTDDSL